MLGFDGRLGQNTVNHVLLDFGLRNCLIPDSQFIHSTGEWTSVIDIQPNAGSKLPVLCNGPTIALVTTHFFSVNIEDSFPAICIVGTGEMVPFVFDRYPFFDFANGTAWLVRSN